MLNHIDLPLIIKDVLNSRRHRVIQDVNGGYTRAAVLIPLFQKDSEYQVLFTKRTHKVENHRGQISFPGGRVDEGDGSLQETALREANEEIGLLREDVTILGQIDDATTLSSNFIIHSFVGLIPYPYNFRINPQEVKRLIQVPFRVFLGDSPLHDSDDTVEYEGARYRTPTYTFQGDVIWGATARIMEDFLRILGEKLALPTGRP
jgi:8-oxo-dGTP pyrophosphatase MutT (NUDIX family)